MLPKEMQRLKQDVKTVGVQEISSLCAERDRFRLLASLLTVRQVIEAGDEYIEAAGLNPWCMREGLATGEERITL